MAENALQRKADAHRGKFLALYRRAFRAGQKVVSAQRIVLALESRNDYAIRLETGKGLQKVDEVLRESLATLVLNLVTAAGNIAGAELPVPPSGIGPAVMKSRPLQTPVRFDRRNPEAIEWAQRYAADQIRDITDESRDAINHVIAQRLSVGASSTETAQVIRMSVGLTEPHATAVMNLNARLLESPGKIVRAGAMTFRVPKGGLDRQKLDAALTKYAERLTRVRADGIARTATRTASTEGQNQMWRQARGKGLLSGAERRQWIASAKACPECQALDGQTATLEGRFPGGVVGPPAHNRCTCSQSLTYD